MTFSLKLAIGETPNWEEDIDTEKDLKGLAERRVASAAIHYSLRQSRYVWLHNVFPKFSHKSRKSVQPEIKQPPHDLRFLSKCDIELGPHVFKDCSFYEAVYTTSHESMPNSMPNSMPMSYPGPSNYLQASHGQHTPYPMSGFTHYVPPTSTEQPSVPKTPPDSSNEMIEVTPALLAQVNEAAATNPTVASLLQATAANVATNEQMRFLGLFIQSLALRTKQRQISGGHLNAIPSSSQQVYNTLKQPIKQSDLILEFRENYNDRFIVPREILACETETMAPGRADIVMYSTVPFKRRTTEDTDKSEAENEQTPVAIRLLSVPHVLSLFVKAWVNEDAKAEGAWDKFYDKSQACKSRAYPRFKLPSGDLLAQLRNACDNGYTMKSIKPPPISDTPAPKRSRQRKNPQNPSTPSSSAQKPIASVKDAANSADAHMALLAAVSRKSPETSAAAAGLRKKKRSSLKKRQHAIEAGYNGLFFVNTTSDSGQLYTQQHSDVLPATETVTSSPVLPLPVVPVAPSEPIESTPINTPTPMEEVQPTTTPQA